MKLSIVVPVYNEATTIERILNRVQTAPLPEGTTREIVVVDDYSTDGTRDVLSRLSGSARIFYHEKNMGKGAALRTGFAQCTGDIVLVQDADLEYDPVEYPKLVGPIIDGRADVVYGSRFIGGQEHRVLYYWHSVANKALTLVSNMLSDLNLTDMETCYKAFRRTVLDQVELQENRFGVEPEITAKIAELAREGGIGVYEVGISYHGRTYEEGKKIGLRDAFRALWCILKYNTSLLARIIRYGFSGLIVAASQFLTVVTLVESLGLATHLMQNVAYAASIEVSILVGFVLHSLVSWRYRFRSATDVAGKLLTFHLVTGISFVVRQALFYVLLEAGVQYRLNTLIGIAVALLLNFAGYHKLVFKKSLPQ